MTVALVTPGFPANDDDDTCVPALHLYASALAAAHPALGVTVVALHYPLEARSYRWRGIPVHAIGGGNAPWPRRIGALARLGRTLASLHAEQTLSLIHGFWLTDAAVAAAAFARRAHVPFLVTLMGQDALPGNRYLALAPRRGARVVMLGERMAATFQEATGRAPDAIVPWGVHDAAVPLAPWMERDLDVLGVGALIPLKDHLLLLEAMARLVARGVARRALLIGEGPERPRLEAEIARLGLHAHVALAGELPRSHVLATMARARLLFHASRSEGFGLVFAEALAHGMAIASRPVGAARAHPAWRTAGDLDGLVAAASELLAGPAPQPENVFPISETLDGYRRLYGA